jgi:hypothetical protein
MISTQAFLSLQKKERSSKPHNLCSKEKNVDVSEVDTLGHTTFSFVGCAVFRTNNKLEFIFT